MDDTKQKAVRNGSFFWKLKNISNFYNNFKIITAENRLSISAFLIAFQYNS